MTPTQESYKWNYNRQRDTIAWINWATRENAQVTWMKQGEVYVNNSRRTTAFKVTGDPMLKQIQKFQTSFQETRPRWAIYCSLEV